MLLMNCSQGCCCISCQCQSPVSPLLWLMPAENWLLFGFFSLGLWLSAKPEEPWELVHGVVVGWMGDVGFPLSTVSGNFIL